MIPLSPDYSTSTADSEKDTENNRQPETIEQVLQTFSPEQLASFFLEIGKALDLKTHLGAFYVTARVAYRTVSNGTFYESVETIASHTDHKRQYIMDSFKVAKEQMQTLEVVAKEHGKTVEYKLADPVEWKDYEIPVRLRREFGRGRGGEGEIIELNSPPHPLENSIPTPVSQTDWSENSTFVRGVSQTDWSGKDNFTPSPPHSLPNSIPLPVCLRDTPTEPVDEGDSNKYNYSSLKSFLEKEEEIEVGVSQRDWSVGVASNPNTIWRYDGEGGRRTCQIPPIKEDDQSTGLEIQRQMDEEGLTAQRVVSRAISLSKVPQLVIALMSISGDVIKAGKEYLDKEIERLSPRKIDESGDLTRDGLPEDFKDALSAVKLQLGINIENDKALQRIILDTWRDYEYFSDALASVAEDVEDMTRKGTLVHSKLPGKLITALREGRKPLNLVLEESLSIPVAAPVFVTDKPDDEYISPSERIIALRDGLVYFHQEKMNPGIEFLKRCLSTGSETLINLVTNTLKMNSDWGLTLEDLA